MSPDQANNTNTPVDSEVGRSGFVDRNLLFRNYPSQLLALQQQHERLLALRDQGLGNDPILAAAVQRQLMAVSLGSSGNMSMFGLGNQSRLGSNLIASHVGPQSSLIHGGFQQVQQSRGHLSIISDPIKKVTDATLTRPSRVLLTKIPCQARGMTSDHNSTTAFFEVTGDTKHGQHLSCSHEGCRASGVKFRYCEFCKKPVTKQNFRSRHLHADHFTEGDPTDPDVSSKTQSRKRNSSGDKKEVMDGKDAMNRGLIPGIGSSGNMFLLQKDFPVVSQPDAIVGARFMSIEADSATFPERPDSMRLNSQKVSTGDRKGRWVSLLSERPRGLQCDIGRWLSTVLEVSDKSRDLQRATATQEGARFSTNTDQARPSTQTEAWKTLLDERPDTTVGSEATEWIMKVLKVSCWDYR